MMLKARLMDTKEDFSKLGIDPHKVHVWEDCIRNSGAVGNNEVWYFDANFEDGSKVIVGFRAQTLPGMAEEGFTPNLNLDITRPDGTTTQEFAFADIKNSSLSKEKCDVRIGSDYCIGDFEEYDVHVESTETLACDLHYRALTKPFRQGTSVIALGDEEENFYTDLCVPKCEVTGTLTYDGKTIEVKGYGYHDHQWMNISPFSAFHHWLWGKMYTDKYIVYIYDFVCAERYGYKRVPYFIVADNKTGDIVFETNGNVTVNTVLESTSVGKKFPKTSSYLFENEDRTAEFNVTWNELLEVRDTYGDAPANKKEALERANSGNVADIEKVLSGTKEQYDAMGIQPTYLRFFSERDIKLTIDGETTESAGKMIYEYNYIGREDTKAGV